MGQRFNAWVLIILFIRFIILFSALIFYFIIIFYLYEGQSRNSNNGQIRQNVHLCEFQMYTNTPYHISDLKVLSKFCLTATSMVARQLKNTWLMTMAATHNMN